MRPFLLPMVCGCAAWLFAARVARAEVWQAPVGGGPIALGEGRVACAGSSGDWAIEQDGHAIKPPAAADAVGHIVDMKVAPNAGACGSSTAALRLVATARWPSIDQTATALFVDDARVELLGRGLRGAQVHWQLGDRSGIDRCVQPQADSSSERCSVAISRGLPADAAAANLTWLPVGATDAPDAVLFDAAGRRVSRDELQLRPGRILVSALVPPDVSIDLAGGTASHIPLVHPEAIAGADCGAVSCAVSGSTIVVGGLSTVSGTLAVRMRLAPRVMLQRGDTLDASPVVQVPILPCGMSIASGDALRGVDETRAVVRVDARCAAEARSLHWFSGGRSLDVLGEVDSGGAAYVLVGVGRVEGDELVITASRAAGDVSIIGQARIRARTTPAPHATLTLEGGGAIDFVPTNRPATVQWVKARDSAQLVLLPLEGVYDVGTRDGSTTVQGQRGAGGFVALRFAWRVPALPGALATADLAVATDPVERPMHEASVPAPISGSATTQSPIVELLCRSGKDEERVLPGTIAHVSFDARDTCRLVFHRERLPADSGAQRLQLDVDVTQVDGTARPDAHVTQTIVLGTGEQPRDVWIKGVHGQFDRATIRLSHAEEQLEGGGQHEPSVQWSVIFGTGHFRLYGTTAIPTGLFRFSDTADSGILSLSLGVLMRATWLDSEGHEGFLGLEGGVMTEGVPADKSTSGGSLTEVATVTGLGLSVPIANRSLATETSINLHAWFEYEISREVARQPGSPFGFVFGPSISIGNVGTNF